MRVRPFSWSVPMSRLISRLCRSSFRSRFGSCCEKNVPRSYGGMWTLTSHASPPRRRTKPSPRLHPFVRMLLTSVPVRTTPASILSTNEYSWKARRFEVIGLMPSSATLTDRFRGLELRQESRLALRVERAVFAAKRALDLHDAPAPALHLAFDDERHVGRYCFSETHFDACGHRALAGRDRGVGHRFIEERRDDTAVHDVRPSAEIAPRQNAAFRGAVAVVERHPQADLVVG